MVFVVVSYLNYRAIIFIVNNFKRPVSYIFLDTLISKTVSNKSFDFVNSLFRIRRNMVFCVPSKHDSTVSKRNDRGEHMISRQRGYYFGISIFVNANA